jgi:heavy metal sensor kinase
VSFLRTIRVRLTLFYVLLLAIALAIFSAGVYFAMRESLYSNLEDGLESRADLVSSIVVQGDQLNVDPDQLPGDGGDHEEPVRVLDASGEVVFDNSEEAPEPEAGAVAEALRGERVYVDASGDDLELRYRLEPIRAEGQVIGAVEVGLPRDDVEESLEALLLIIAIAYPLTLVLATIGGLLIAGRALAPIDRVTTVARRISAEDLSQRLDMQLPDDEVGRLARTFDEMIARLDDAFRRQRQFTADASHELRTPLTAIKGQTEVALQRERDGEEYREVLTTVNSEVDRMIRLVASLLTLARADARQIGIARDSVDLGELAGDAVAQIRPAAEAKRIGIGTTSDGAVRITADEDLVLQLVLNLLDNAVKYTPEGGRVEVVTRVANGHAELSVSDNGPGIPAEHLARVFDRFYRVDPARTHGGAGLGLSISRWIAEAHGGTIDVESAPGEGSRFTVRLPISADRLPG